MTLQEIGKKILVVGGYGNVGRIICTKLSQEFPGAVIAAGPDLAKAELLAYETSDAVIPRQLDVFNRNQIRDALEDVGLVIMCLDQTDTNFVEDCIRRGIHYIDITASYEFLSRVEDLHEKAKEDGATVILSVGLAPGVTNLLASHAKTEFDTLEAVDIFVLLGLGEAHGKAAIRWSLEKMNAEYTVLEDGKIKAAHGFGQRKKTTFPEGIGTRWAYSFDFSDQHVLPQTLGVRSAATWLTFDSALMTTFYAWLKQLGGFRLLDIEFVKDLFVRILGRVQVGSDQYVLQVDANGEVNGEPRASREALTGRNEGIGTALVAAQVAECLFTATYPGGVFHIEQLFEPLDFIRQLQNADSSIHFVEERE
ncbi:MAG: saccharopine dehydrogenase [Chloroflexi bacterium]|nr:MAG: saccharopine dehydrogenase [Chloroflexota bacterium]